MSPVTRKPWFGPRRLFGWGWSPITWQGWGVIVLFIAGVACAVIFLHSVALILLAEAVLIVALVVVCYLTSGPPTATWGKKSDR